MKEALLLQLNQLRDEHQQTLESLVDSEDARTYSLLGDIALKIARTKQEIVFLEAKRQVITTQVRTTGSAPLCY